MRIAHITDIHFYVPPRIGQLPGKRLLGTANLYLRGRRHEFSPQVQACVVQTLQDLKPDAVVISGDLTAQATAEEFDAAFTALRPVLDSVPTFVIPGNHDVYTRGAQQTQRIRERFGAWMAIDEATGIGRLDVDGVTFIGLDPNRPTFLFATGVLPPRQLEGLRSMLDAPDLAERTVILCIHYPIVGPDSTPYDNRGHGLLNATEVIETLRGVRHAPTAVLHGHKHHGARATLDLGTRQVPSFNPGSAGLAYDADHGRCAAINVYEVGAGPIRVQRWLHDGQTFQVEEGGAYASGW